MCPICFGVVLLTGTKISLYFWHVGWGKIRSKIWTILAIMYVTTSLTALACASHESFPWTRGRVTVYSFNYRSPENRTSVWSQPDNALHHIQSATFEPSLFASLIFFYICCSLRTKDGLKSLQLQRPCCWITNNIFPCERYEGTWRTGERAPPILMRGVLWGEWLD